MKHRFKLIIGFTIVCIVVPGSLLYIVLYGSVSQFFHMPFYVSSSIPKKFNTEFLNSQQVLADTNEPNPALSVDTSVSSQSSQAQIQSFSAGDGITLTPGGKTVIANSGVLSLQNKTGNLTLGTGSGIGIDGLTVTNTDKGSAQNIFKNIAVLGQGTIITNSNNDTLSFGSGDGITLTTDTKAKTVTISQTLTGGLSPLSLLYADSNNHLASFTNGTSGYLLESNGANALPIWIAPSSLTTSSLPFSSLTSSTSTQSAFVIGNGSSLTSTGTGTIDATTLLNGTWNSPGRIGLTTPNTGAFTSLNASGLTISSLSTGIAHISNTGVFSSSSVNLASNDISGILPVTNGGTGIIGYTAGDLPYASGATTLAKLGIGATNTVLTSSGTIPHWSSSLTLSGLSVNGNVGLGTTTPGTLLDLVGGGIRANGPARTGIGTGYHVFEGNYTSGSVNNYLGSGNYAYLNNLIGASDMHAGFGVFTGNNIVSPTVWMYNATYNAFDVRKVNYNQDPSLGTSLFVVRSSGNVGINTTSPNFRLDVEDSQSASAAAQVFNTSTSSTTTGLVIKLGKTTSTLPSTNHFISFETSGIGIIGSIQGNGANGVTFKQSGIADFAEYFPKDQTTSIPFGSLVCLNTNGNVLPCDTFHSTIVGIASEHPAFLGGSDKGSASIPVGLTGLVLAKVSSANGNILPGDMITASTMPGVGVKATQNGIVVGQAVNVYTNTDTKAIGTILVSVHVSWYSPSQTQMVSDDSLTNTNDATVSGALSVSGKTLLSDVGITGKLNSGLLTINGMDLDASSAATINTLSGSLKLQSLALGGIDFLNGKVVIDTEGNIHLTNTITADKYNVNSQSHAIGEAEIPAGKTLLEVKTDAVTNNSRVFLTSETTTDIPLSVTQKKSQSSFTVELSRPDTKPITFSWWVIN